MWVFMALAVLAAISVVLTTVQAVLTVRFRRRRFFHDGLHEQAVPAFPQEGFSPRVSILKPVCGLEDELEANLESFTRIRGVRFELLLSVADPHDPAIPIIERFRDERFRLIVGGDPALERTNRKIARLIAAEEHARGEILFISDANVRVEPDDVAQTIAEFRDPGVGCVSSLFTGSGAQSLGATIESLHLLSFVATGSVLAAFCGVPCVVGKSMAIRREVLRTIGGFRAFAGVLAEDQAIGLAVREAGYRVGLSPVVVRNVVTRRTIRRALGRQIRWNKIRFAFSHAMYAAEFLVNPLPLALAASVVVPGIVPLVLILRWAQVAMLSMATGADLRLGQVLATPVLDLLQFAAQFVPYYDDRVTWRGYTARIGPATTLLDIQPAAA